VRAVPDIFERQAKAGQWAALLTLAWFLTVPVLVVSGFFASLSYGSQQVSEDHTGAWLLLAGAVLAVFFPLLAAVLGFRGGRPVLGTVYALLTLALLVPAGLAAMGATKDLGGYQPAAPEPRPGPPGMCMDHSGGQGECPGG
jgi:hypothetical protein